MKRTPCGVKRPVDDETYLHATFKSRVFRFIDDLELFLNPSNGVISIRSAARTGYWDFGFLKVTTTKGDNMKKLKEYFESTKGSGVLATADSSGKVDATIYVYFTLDKELPLIGGHA